MSYLAQDSATRDYRLDAVHLGICLQHYGVLGISGDTDAGVGQSHWVRLGAPPLFR